MVVVEYILTFVIGLLVLTTCLWLAMKITGVSGTFVALLITAVAASLIGLIPTVGFYLSIIALFVGITKFTDAELWPGAILMVIVSWGIYLLIMMFLISALVEIL